MLNIKSVNDVMDIIENRFGMERAGTENVSLVYALGRVLAEDIYASEYIPNFDRSTVDGYAIKVEDLVGCSDSSPAILRLVGQSKMGEHTVVQITNGQCAYVPTGGEVPGGTEAVVMLEDTTDLGDGSIGICKSCPAGMNMIVRGEDMEPGDLVISAGKRLKVADTGTLAAMGVVNVPVMKSPRVGIITTGDELVPASEPLTTVGMIHDVNTPMLHHAIQSSGGIPCEYGIIKDDRQLIGAVVQKAIGECDIVIISGGTSMDSRDTVSEVIGKLGEVIVHGIAVKPGKPTIFASIQGKPVFGLPGNPVSAYFTFYLFIRPLLHWLQGTKVIERKLAAPLMRTVVTNHGREEYVPIILQDGFAQPVASKSGLITTVSCADGFIRVPKDCNEIKQGQIVEVTLLEN